MTKRTHPRSYLIASLLLAGSAGCLASQDQADDRVDFGRDKSLMVRVWDLPQYDYYRAFTQDDNSALDAYCEASARPLRFVQLAEMMLDADGARELSLVAAGCAGGKINEMFHALVPLGKATVAAETAADGSDLYFGVYSADGSTELEVEWTGYVTVHHAALTEAPDERAVSISLPIVADMATTINVLSAETLVLRK